MWEQRYELLKPTRTATNLRRYSDDDLKKILNIAYLNACGIKISNLTQLPRQELSTLVQEQKAREVDVHKHPLLHHIFQYQPEQYLSDSRKIIAEQGLEQYIENTAFPLLKHVGNLWMSDNLLASQEHILSHCIRQLLLENMGKIRAQNIDLPKTIFFLPENEYHELPLLYAHYLFAVRKFPCLYMGTNVPSAELELAVSKSGAQIILTHVTHAANIIHTEKFVTQLVNIANGNKLIVTGNYTSKASKDVNMMVCNTISDLKNWLDNNAGITI